MKAAIDFMKKTMFMKFPWNIWVNILGMVNFIGGLIFITTTEGKFALISMIIAS